MRKRNDAGPAPQVHENPSSALGKECQLPITILKKRVLPLLGFSPQFPSS